MYYLPGAEIFLLVLTSEENEGEGTGMGGSRTLAAMSVRCSEYVLSPMASKS